MKAINDLIFLDDARYTENHEWAKQEGDVIRIGISDYAQDQLGDIVFVELPEVGVNLSKGDEFGTVESVKAVSELYIPIGGEVIAINQDLVDMPDLVNSEPYDSGWMLEIRASNPTELATLKSKAEYLEILKG